MIFEWDARKAATNLQKHRVAFEDAATVFRDLLAMTFPDPDHSEEEGREITVGYTIKGAWCSFLTANEGSASGLSAPDSQRGLSVSNMKKAPVGKPVDELRREYDLSRLKGGVRGKYYRRATAAGNLVLIEPDLATLFPDSEAVNRALRVLADAAQAVANRKIRRRHVG